MKEINLLPKERQRELFYEVILHDVMTVIWLSLASFVLVFGAQLLTKLYLGKLSLETKDRIGTLQTQVNKEENSKIKTTIKTNNNLIQDFNNLAAASPKWSKMLKAFVPLVPSGVKIHTLTAESTKKSVTINGFSPTRELVIKLYDNLKNDGKNFYDVNYPLENLAEPTEVNFHFTFYVKDELLK